MFDLNVNVFRVPLDAQLEVPSALPLEPSLTTSVAALFPCLKKLSLQRLLLQFWLWKLQLEELLVREDKYLMI